MSLLQMRSYVWPYRWYLALGLALMLLESVAALLMPWLGGKIAGSLLSEREVGVNVLAPALLAILLFQAVLQVGQRRVLSMTTERLSASVRIGLYAHIQSLPLAFFQTRRRGDFLALLTREVDILTHFITGSLLGVLPKVFMLIGALVLMLSIDPVLTLPVMLAVPAFFIALKLVGRRLRPLSGEMRDAYARFVSVAEQNLSVLPIIKSFTVERAEAARHDVEVSRYRDLSLRFIAIDSLIGPALQFLSAAGVVIVLWLASTQVKSGSLSPAELVTFLLYAAVLTRPISGLADLWGQFQHAKGALKHMAEILEAEVEDSETGKDPGRVRGHIRFEGLGFSYPDRPVVLQNLNLEIPAGQSIAITGANGAGKSTLVELLLRFRQPSEGRILIDGQDIAGLNLAALRRAIALVPQQVSLIDGTIEENIRFGNQHALRKQVEQAVREAEAADFIAALPDGLQTVIGERGVRLSGGQRQRVALARALLKKPAILVLDEATAMFDPDSEARFVDLARTALKGKTVILITHRPASLVLADRVMKLQGGRFLDTAKGVLRVGT